MFYFVNFCLLNNNGKLSLPLIIILICKVNLSDFNGVVSKVIMKYSRYSLIIISKKS